MEAIVLSGGKAMKDHVPVAAVGAPTGWSGTAKSSGEIVGSKVHFTPIVVRILLKSAHPWVHSWSGSVQRRGLIVIGQGLITKRSEKETRPRAADLEWIHNRCLSLWFG